MPGIPPVPQALLALDAKLLNQGAEGRVFAAKFLGRDVVVKERFSKSYRHPVLDQRLTAKRLYQECKTMLKAKKAGIRTPTIVFVDQQQALIYMDLIAGPTVRAAVQTDAAPWSDETKSLAAAIGRTLAKLHDADIVHGDLTTSNMMLLEPNSALEDKGLVVIDFGLSYTTALAEDKAVDLYVLERAFISTHIDSEALVKIVLESYGTASSKGTETLEKLDEVRLRGRKKLAFG
mmetsp:Transcript_11847/g.47805  ORF Transcript_11847/g.47805 Transcript_11847/m.47805 type:complete len:234 (-) Transcript_11847:193-894(-)